MEWLMIDGTPGAAARRKKLSKDAEPSEAGENIADHFGRVSNTVPMNTVWSLFRDVAASARSSLVWRLRVTAPNGQSRIAAPAERATAERQDSQRNRMDDVDAGCR
jgi:hypothetical protein